jgi:hypothetical protein
VSVRLLRSPSHQGVHKRRSPHSRRHSTSLGCQPHHPVQQDLTHTYHRRHRPQGRSTLSSTSISVILGPTAHRQASAAITVLPSVPELILPTNRHTIHQACTITCPFRPPSRSQHVRRSLLPSWRHHRTTAGWRPRGHHCLTRPLAISGLPWLLRRTTQSTTSTGRHCSAQLKNQPGLDECLLFLH